MIKVAIVILNWNGREYLERFLPFVVKHSNPDISEIYVADNASTDDSLAMVTEKFPALKQIILDKNYGFAEGYNRALEKIEARYFLLLNSDVEVTENWLLPLVKTMDSNPLIAGCSPKLKDFNHRDFFEYAGGSGGYIDKLGYAFCRGRLFDSMEHDYGQYDAQTEILWTTGACMMIRAELFKLLGGFDGNYFAHFEEIDLCWRLKNRGYRFVSVPESVVYHIGGGTLPASNPRKTYLNYRNNLITLYKNTEASVLRKRIISRLLFDGLSGIRFLLQLKIIDLLAIFKAHFSFFKEVKRLKKFRKEELPYIKNFNHKEIYSGNLVKEYFLRSNKSYSSLKWR